MLYHPECTDVVAAMKRLLHHTQPMKRYVTPCVLIYHDAPALLSLHGGHMSRWCISMLAVERQHAVNISAVTGRYLSLNHTYVSPGTFILTDLLQTQQLRRSLSFNAITFGAYIRRLPVVTEANCRALNQRALCQLKTFSSSLLSVNNSLILNEQYSKYSIF